MWADRAFQMLHPVQPKRKRECTAQDALKHRRGRRGREGGGFPSLFLGLMLWMAMSTFGTSPRCAVTDTRQRNHLWNPWGCTAPVGQLWELHTQRGSGASPPWPHPTEDGRWEMERICLWEGRSAPLSPAGTRYSLPKSGSQGEHRQLGMVFGMFGFARSGAALEGSQIPCTPS